MDFSEVNLKVMQNQCVVVKPCRVMLAVLDSWAEPLQRSEARTSHSRTVCLSFHHPESVQSSCLQPNGSWASIHVGADELRCISPLVADASLTSYFHLRLCSLSRVMPPHLPPAYGFLYSFRLRLLAGAWCQCACSCVFIRLCLHGVVFHCLRPLGEKVTVQSKKLF